MPASPRPMPHVRELHRELKHGSKHAAERFGVTQDVIRRWEKSPEYRALIASFGRRARDLFAADAPKDYARAAKVLRELVDDPVTEPHARINALRALVDLHERIHADAAALAEAAAAALDGAPAPGAALAAKVLELLGRVAPAQHTPPPDPEPSTDSPRVDGADCI